MTHFPVRCTLIILFLFVVLVWQTTAQENDPIVLSVQLPEFMENFLTNLDLSDFEAAHPNVEVHVIYEPYALERDALPPTFEEITEHLDTIDTSTLEADIFLMSVGDIPWLSVEATRAGYILDLAPLFNADSRVDASVYYPTIWQAAQWDGGLWMLPTSAQIGGLFYDPDAFDAAGLAYPDANWTFSDFVNAIDILATRDSSGNVILPGFSSYNLLANALLYQALEHPPYDTSQSPYMPQFLRPDVLELASQWIPALSSGAAFNPWYEYIEYEPYSSDTTPLNLVPVQAMDDYLRDFELAPLPEGMALVNIKGIVVSSRTQYPQLAYELASYLAADILFARATQISIGGVTLARPEYPSVVNDNIPVLEIPQGAQSLVNDALHNGIPASELLYMPYLQSALWQVAQGEADIETALRDAETLATDNLEVAAQRRSEIVGTIPTPVPEVVLAPNEIELTFYHQEGDSTLWNNFAQEFAESDSEVGRVVMQSSSYPFDYREDSTDCFYNYSNFSPATDDYDYVIDIAPLLAADNEFDAENWLTGVFDPVQRGESIYGLPMDIRPLALWYDPAQLQAQGLQAPHSGSELVDALMAFSNEGQMALSAYQLDTTLLMLIAEQGAILINYESDPIQIDYTSDNSVNAIQRVLDLARDGTIKYGSLSDFTSSSFPESEPFISDYVMDSLFRGADYLPVVFPSGTEYTPVSFSLMAGFISRFSQYPEACYRLLKSLSHRPDLLAGMPAQRSEASRSDYASFYDDFNQQLNASNLVIVSGNYAGAAYNVPIWLWRAFDRYVLEGADLLAELSSAEQFSKEYVSCVENGGGSYDCVLQVDPTIADNSGG